MTFICKGGKDGSVVRRRSFSRVYSGLVCCCGVTLGGLHSCRSNMVEPVCRLCMQVKALPGVILGMKDESRE